MHNDGLTTLAGSVVNQVLSADESPNDFGKNH